MNTVLRTGNPECFAQACWCNVLRSSSFPDGLTSASPKDKAVLALANLVTANAFRLVTAFCKVGVPVSIENPHGSLLWQCSAFKAWQAEFNPQTVVIDYCCFGEPYRKRTRLITWHRNHQADGKSFLHELARKCPGVKVGKHEHQNLSGWRPRNRPGVVMTPTKGTGSYPVKLCKVWAAAVRGHVQLATRVAE